MCKAADWDYLALLHNIYQNGENKPDRTGTGTRSLFGPQLRFDLRQGFPLITTKKLYTRGIIAELLWFLSGSTSIRPLQAQNVHIWDEWADPNGDLGPVYGHQWRAWEDYPWNTAGPIDQIAKVIHDLRTNPHSRRHIVSAWNVGDLPDMALEPCHVMFQFYVTEHSRLGDWRQRLHCHMYQRSADMFLGVPFNIASYALLTHMIAQCSYMGVGDLIISFGDAHIYKNHVDQVREQLSRAPKDPPNLWLNIERQEIDEFTIDDIRVEDYEYWPPIKAPIAV